MTVEYIYNEPVMFDLDQLLLDIAASAMTDKAVDYARWDEDSSGTELCVFWPSALSAEDEILLNAVVAAI